MYNQPPCEAPDIATGWAVNCGFDFSAVTKLFFQNPNDSFDSEADAKDQAVWGTKIAAKDILPTDFVLETDDNSEDDSYYTSPNTAIDIFTKEGKSKFNFRLQFQPGLYQRLRQLNGTSQRLILGDGNNNVIGTSPDDIIFQGSLSGTLRVGKWIAATDSTPAFIPIYWAPELSIERNDRVSVFNVAWNLQGLNGVQPATLTVFGTPTATEIVVDIVQSDSNVAITGITELTDFQVLEADGITEEPVTVVAESGTIPGRYTLTGVAFETGGTVNLNSVVTIGTAYYQGTAVAVTFP